MKTKIEERPVNLSTVAHFFDLKPQTVNVWYKNQLSGYKEAKESGGFMDNRAQIIDKDTGEIVKESVIYIFEPQNVGSSMCIDEKMLGGKYYVILSNTETGKIAFLIGTMNPVLIGNGLQQMGAVLDKIERINCDMSPTMKKLCSDNFKNSSIIIDKFHVIKQVLDALNSVRLDVKKQIKELEQTSKNNPNNWTDIECLEKCKYLIFSMKEQLDEEQLAQLNQILKKFPTLNEAYEITQKIRTWYAKENIGKHIWDIEKAMDFWMIDLEKTKLKAFKIIRKMFVKHEDDINRYFEKGSTNAKAENLNARLQRFLANNFGMKDPNFFFFRVKGYFA